MAGYLARHGTPSGPADLDGHECIAFAPMSEIRSWRFQVGGEHVLHHDRGRGRTADAEQVRAAVIAGLGIATPPVGARRPRCAR